MDRHLFDVGPDPGLDPTFLFDADPDPIRIRIRIGIKTMPIHMRILPQVLQYISWKIVQTFLTFVHSNASLVSFSVYYVFLFSSVANVQ